MQSKPEENKEMASSYDSYDGATKLKKQTKNNNQNGLQVTSPISEPNENEQMTNSPVSSDYQITSKRIFDKQDPDKNITSQVSKKPDSKNKYFHSNKRKQGKNAKGKYDSQLRKKLSNKKFTINKHGKNNQNQKQKLTKIKIIKTSTTKIQQNTPISNVQMKEKLISEGLPSFSKGKRTQEKKKFTSKNNKQPKQIAPKALFTEKEKSDSKSKGPRAKSNKRNSIKNPSNNRKGQTKSNLLKNSQYHQEYHRNNTTGQQSSSQNKQSIKSIQKQAKDQSQGKQPKPKTFSPRKKSNFQRKQGNAGKEGNEVQVLLKQKSTQPKSNTLNNQSKVAMQKQLQIPNNLFKEDNQDLSIFDTINQEIINDNKTRFYEYSNNNNQNTNGQINRQMLNENGYSQEDNVKLQQDTFETLESFQQQKNKGKLKVNSYQQAPTKNNEQNQQFQSRMNIESEEQDQNAQIRLQKQGIQPTQKSISQQSEQSEDQQRTSNESQKISSTESQSESEDYSESLQEESEIGGSAMNFHFDELENYNDNLKKQPGLFKMEGQKIELSDQIQYIVVKDAVQLVKNRTEKQFIYDIELRGSSKSDQNFTEELQMREIHCENLKDFEHMMGILIDYKNALQNCSGVQMYQKIFDITSAQEEYFDPVTRNEVKPFVVYVVQERLTRLVDKLKQMQKMNIKEQKTFFNKLILQLATQMNQLDDNITTYLGMNLDNIFVRNVEKTDKNSLGFEFVFTFQYLKICPRSKYKHPQVQNFIEAHTCSAFIIQKILNEISRLRCQIIEHQKEIKIKQLRDKLVLKKGKQKKDEQQLAYLDKGSSAKVYEVKNSGPNGKACKQFKKQTFKEIQKYYKEAQFGLLFQEQQLKTLGKLPLMSFEDVFLDYDPYKAEPFTLNIIMPKAQDNVYDLIEKVQQKKQKLPFKVFFPIFRDCILGLVYMHNQGIAHCDIKPSNILIMNENSYKITDYGEGENLNFNCNYLKKVNFQIGNWPLRGTPSYFAPRLFEHYQKYFADSHDFNRLFNSKIKGDLFKFDIYSLGVSLLEVATCKRFTTLNQEDFHQKHAYQELFKTHLPLCIKQTIMHMIAWRQEDRIPTASLYYALKDIQVKLFQGLNFGCQDESVLEKRQMYEDVYGTYKYEYELNDKLQQISLMDQSFYTGHYQFIPWFIYDEEHSKIYVNNIVIVKPQFLVKKVIDVKEEENEEDNVCLIVHEGKKVWVKLDQCIKVKLVKYKQGDFVKYFTDQKNNNWTDCLISKLYETEEKYVIRYKSEDGKIKKKKLPFNTVHLVPGYENFFFQNLTITQHDLLQHIYQDDEDEMIRKDEIEIIPNVIFNINFETMSSEEIQNMQQDIKINLTEKNYTEFRFQDSGLKIENQKQHKKFVEGIPYSMFVQKIYIENCCLDQWQNVGSKFPDLKEIEICQSFYKNTEIIEALLKSLVKLKKLHSLKIFEVTGQEPKAERNIVDPIFKVLNSCPITKLTLLQWQNQDSKSTNFNTFLKLWKVLGKTKMKELKIDLKLTEDNKDRIKQLKKAIKKFFEIQSELETLWLEVDLYKTNYGFELFQCLPSFFKKHKTFKDLIVQITASNVQQLESLKQQITKLFSSKPRKYQYRCVKQGNYTLEITK